MLASRTISGVAPLAIFMGETVFRIGLNELKVLRVRCKCGAVAEIEIAKISGLDRSACPGCENHYCVGTGGGGSTVMYQGPFSAFQNVVEMLGTLNARFTIEFPLQCDARHPATDAKGLTK